MSLSKDTSKDQKILVLFFINCIKKCMKKYEKELLLVEFIWFFCESRYRWNFWLVYQLRIDLNPKFWNFNISIASDRLPIFYFHPHNFDNSDNKEELIYFLTFFYGFSLFILSQNFKYLLRLSMRPKIFFVYFSFNGQFFQKTGSQKLLKFGDLHF